MYVSVYASLWHCISRLECGIAFMGECVTKAFDADKSSKDKLALHTNSKHFYKVRTLAIQPYNFGFGNNLMHVL